jgi:drug/metabolite transporter (DMT)-like permease
MIFDYTILLLIGFIWGATNYLIEIYYYDYDNIEEFSFPMKIIHFIRKNYIPLLFFIMNQSASILFYFSLSQISLSATVIITNSFSFITTLIFEIIHKRKSLTKSKF